MTSYRIEVLDADGTPLGQFTNFRDLKFGKRLNNYGTCQFTIPANDTRASSLVALRRYTIQIWREEQGVPPQVVWAGEQAVRRGQLTDTADNWVTIYCYTFLERFNSRYTPSTLSYENELQEDIAADLLVGKFGIDTTEITPTGVYRDREYHNDNIMEVVLNLTNVINGFDIDINDFNTVVIAPIIGVDRRDSVVLEYGHNVATVSIDEDFSTPVNKAVVLGLPEGSSDQVRVEADDVESQGIYDIREKVIVEPDISEIETFTDKAEALLQKYRYPLFKIDVEILPSKRPTIKDLSIGDIIRVKVLWGIYDIDASYRVFEWEVNVEENGTEALGLVLGQYTLEEEE